MKSPYSIDDLQNIWQQASKMHDGQKYGGKDDGEQVEYINHIGSVAFEILNAINNTEDINAELAIACALLHDTIEDTNLSYTKIKEQFGEAIANGVLALTKSTEIVEKAEKMLDSLTRIKKQPKEVWAVKMADRITNLYAPPFYWTNEKKKEYLEEAKLIHKELQEGNVYLANRLAQKIEAYNRFIL